MHYFMIAVIEHVRDGCTLRAMVVPSFEMLTVAMSGIKVSSYSNTLFLFLAISLSFSVLHLRKKEIQILPSPLLSRLNSLLSHVFYSVMSNC